MVSQGPFGCIGLNIDIQKSRLEYPMDDQNRTRVLNLATTSKFYKNLLEMYPKHSYSTIEIWNLNETNA